MTTRSIRTTCGQDLPVLRHGGAGLVTLERRGALRTVMFFEEGRYRRCEYVTPFMTFEMCIYSRRVDNRLSESGGSLYLDYAAEMKGAAAQRVKLNLELTKI